MMNSSIKQVYFDPNSSIICPTAKVNSDAKVSNQTIIRRSGNFKPPIWKHEYIQLLNREFKIGRIKIFKLVVFFVYLD